MIEELGVNGLIVTVLECMCALVKVELRKKE